MNESSGTNTLFRKDLDSFISIHMHKSGGTTFGHILMEMYGDGLFWDHSEDTVNFHGKVRHYNMNEVAKYKIIHGHIHVNKYRILNRPYITWLRHPISRLESEYSVIRQKRITVRTPEYHRKVITEQLSFLDYCKAHREVYSRYLGNMFVEDFAFIGIIEHYKKSLHVLSKVLGKKIPSYFKRNTRKIHKQLFTEGTTDEKYECSLLNSKDIEFYYQAEDRLLKEFETCSSDYDKDDYEPKQKQPSKRYYRHG